MRCHSVVVIIIFVSAAGGKVAELGGAADRRF